VGTPAITTRGFGVEETVQLTHWMCDILDGLEHGNSEQIIAEVKAKVLDVCQRFPVYQ
jgi:glycine hydroxymethyltransferase